MLSQNPSPKRAMVAWPEIQAMNSKGVVGTGIRGHHKSNTMVTHTLNNTATDIPPTFEANGDYGSIRERVMTPDEGASRRIQSRDT